MDNNLENEMETTEYVGMIRVYSPPEVDRTWLWVKYNKIPIYPIFCLLKGHCTYLEKNLFNTNCTSRSITTLWRFPNLKPS